MSQTLLNMTNQAQSWVVVDSSVKMCHGNTHLFSACFIHIKFLTPYIETIMAYIHALFLVRNGVTYVLLGAYAR